LDSMEAAIFPKIALAGANRGDFEAAKTTA
jgi:hypothetical protein